MRKEQILFQASPAMNYIHHRYRLKRITVITLILKSYIGTDSDWNNTLVWWCAISAFHDKAFKSNAYIIHEDTLRNKKEITKEVNRLDELELWRKDSKQASPTFILKMKLYTSFTILEMKKAMTKAIVYFYYLYSSRRTTEGFRYEYL